MARFLADILQQCVGNTERHVKNSFGFAEEISKITVPEGNIMFSLDVVSLFTNVPRENVYDCVKRRWNDIQKHTAIPLTSLLNAIKMILDATFFQYEGNFYEQTEGAPMGSPLSPVVANLVMEDLELEVIDKLTIKNTNLTMYRRYVDDCFLIGKEEEVEAVLHTFNEANASIKFTMEKEHNNQLRFLDLLLTREGTKIRKKWTPKQEGARYLDFLSDSPFQHKRNTAIALLDRAINLTDVDSRKQTIESAIQTLRRNNYPESLIRSVVKERVDLSYNTDKRIKHRQNERFVALPYIPCLSERIAKTMKKRNLTTSFKTCDKVKNLLFTKLKDPVPTDQQTNVVYQIPCGACTDKVYIGQTTQTLAKRIGQHKNSIRTNTSVTGLTQHTTDAGHLFDFNSTKVLERIENDDSRLAAETLHIKLREKSALNLQRESLNFSSAYDGMLRKLRTMKRQTERN